MPGELYERLLGQHATKPKIHTDGLQACMRLFRLSQLSGGAAGMTVDQIDALFEAQCGAALGTSSSGPNAGRQEVADLLAVLPNRSSTANRLDLIERSAVIEAVLVVADYTPAQAPYDTPANLRNGLRAALVALGAPANSLPDRS